jgi:hypothetical protein
MYLTLKNKPTYYVKDLLSRIIPKQKQGKERVMDKLFNLYETESCFFHFNDDTLKLFEQFQTPLEMLVSGFKATSKVLKHTLSQATTNAKKSKIIIPKQEFSLSKSRFNGDGSVKIVVLTE